MIRYGFVMQLKGEDAIREYERLHREIGEDVLAAHRRSGIRNYSIFRDGVQLFACFEADDPEASIERLAREPIMKEWWAKTNPLMEVDSTGMPRIRRLPEVFHLD
ncbi:MAG: L-rhamnose mutarotase [Planctomycetes bacterium]|nr:L-rhamnose mutarotase [Planctomycetota bacterium]